MADQVSSMSEELMKAVIVTMDPETSHTFRLEALKFCENFKDTSSLCVPCGLQLADKAQPAVVRHFGLQILEHVIKFRWNDMEQQEKVQLKESALQLLSTGIDSILEEESHIKDALSRIMVEMIKREWPQQWPDMLKEMETLTEQGEAQSELVMLILLRLAEDVITFQTLPAQRRKDIQMTLTQNMDNIFSFLMAILHINVEDYDRVKKLPEHEMKARAHCRVAVSALNTLAGYIDWVSLVHITSGNCRLLEMLCLLLSEPELQLEAAECLVIALSRKGKLEERKPFMVLFKDVAIDYILSAAQSADELAICTVSTNPLVVKVVERRYNFLKRLCQVLCALGLQLCSLVGTDVKVDVPVNLSKYTQALLAFTTHSSQFLKSCTLPIWGAFFRHQTLSKDATVVDMAMQYLKSCMTNFIKTGYPSRHDHQSSEYSRVDFDNDDDFHAFFSLFRAQQGDVLRRASRIVPIEAFQTAAEWLRVLLTSPIDIGDTTSKSAEGLCSLLSPSVIQWDAMSVFFDCVISQISRKEKDELPIEQSMELLQAVLNYNTKDPLILSCVLTVISALFTFAIHRPQIVPHVLDKLFSAIAFEIGQEKKFPRSRAVKNLRRHACSSIIKICRDYPQILLPSFDVFYSHVKELLSADNKLMYMEKCSLMEALVLISNQFKNFEKQKAFLDELLVHVMNEWTSAEFRSVIWDPAKFLSFIGADQVVMVQNEEPNGAGINRGRLNLCLTAMLVVVKRARWPVELEEAKAGGFVVGFTAAGAPIYRNPCAAQFLAFLPNLLALIRTHNSLFLPENMARLSETFSRAHEMMDAEKKVVLGLTQSSLDVHDSPLYRSHLERMQGFFWALCDNCFQILGNAGPSLQQEFYTIDKLTEGIAGSVFFSLDTVPDYRLRPMIRLFIKLLATSCPPEYHSNLLLPLLGPLFNYLTQRLNIRWQTINQRSSSNEEEEEEAICEESQVTQEMLEEHLVRLLTREVLELVSVSCISRKVPEPAATKEEIDEDEMMMDSVQQMASPPNASDEITELGKSMIKHEEIYMSLLTLSFSSLAWKDTTNCHRMASTVCWSLLRQVVGQNLLAEAVIWFFTSVLGGLQVHGQHEACNSSLSYLAMHIYDNLRPHYIELKAVMTQIPNINTDSLEIYDLRLMDPKGQRFGEKKRKDHFKKLIAGVVGKALCQQFKKEVHIRNLPSLFKNPKPNNDILDSESLGLAALFAPVNDTP